MPNTPKSHRQRIAATVGRKWSDRQYEAKRMADPRLARAKRIRNSARYQRFRKWFVQHHPICEDPESRHRGEVIAAVQVHHKKPLREAPGLALSESNCLAVCAGCHASLEAKYSRRVGGY